MSIFLYAGLFCAGGLGALSRYGVSKLGSRYWKKPFPLPIFMVNCLGSFVYGVLSGLFVKLLPEVLGYTDYTTWPVALILLSFLSGFTTFSTAMLESLELARQDFWLVSQLALWLQPLAALMCASAGLYLI